MSNENIPEVSMTNTKKEMLEAYSTLVKMLDEKEKQSLIPEKIVEDKKRKETINIADTLANKGLIEGINTLKAEINKMLVDLSDKLDNETQKYNSIKQAIELKESELKELFDIDKSAHSLAALINAQQEKKESFEQEMIEKKEKLENEITEQSEKFEIEKIEQREKWKKEQTEQRELWKKEHTEQRELWKKEQTEGKDEGEEGGIRRRRGKR